MMLEEFLEKNGEKYIDIEFPNLTINKIIEQYKEKKAKEHTFKETLAIYDIETN